MAAIPSTFVRKYIFFNPVRGIHFWAIFEICMHEWSQHVWYKRPKQGNSYRMLYASSWSVLPHPICCNNKLTHICVLHSLLLALSSPSEPLPIPSAPSLLLALFFSPFHLLACSFRGRLAAELAGHLGAMSSRKLVLACLPLSLFDVEVNSDNEQTDKAELVSARPRPTHTPSLWSIGYSKQGIHSLLSQKGFLRSCPLPPSSCPMLWVWKGCEGLVASHW